MFALVSGARAAPTPDPLFSTGLDWKPGTTCTYDIVHNGKKARWTFAVSEASGDKVNGTWTRDASSPIVSVPVVKTEKGLKFTEDMSMIHGTPMTAEPGYQWLAFPLEPGKSWEGRSVVSGTDAASKPWKVDVTYSSKVSDWEKVKTPAGESAAVRIVTDEKIAGLSANFSGTVRGTLWTRWERAPSRSWNTRIASRRPPAWSSFLSHLVENGRSDEGEM